MLADGDRESVDAGITDSGRRVALTRSISFGGLLCVSILPSSRFMDVHTVLLTLAKRASVRILYRWPSFSLGIMRSRG